MIIFEGLEADCKEYIRRLKCLNWKHLALRGEEIEHVGLEPVEDGGENSPPKTLDDYRKVKGFTEFGKEDMHVLAEKCRECGLHELFLTCMRIYK